MIDHEFKLLGLKCITVKTKCGPLSQGQRPTAFICHKDKALSCQFLHSLRSLSSSLHVADGCLALEINDSENRKMLFSMFLF